MNNLNGCVEDVVDDGDDDVDNITTHLSSESAWSPMMDSWSSSASSEEDGREQSEASFFQGIEGMGRSDAGAATSTATDATAVTATAVTATSATIAISDGDNKSHTADDTTFGSSSNAANTITTMTMTTSTPPNFQRGQNVFVTIGKADHVAKFDSYIFDETSNLPLLAKVKYSSSLLWDQVEIGQLKPMHFEENGELVTSSYSKRMRQETNRYKPLMGGGNDAAGGKASADTGSGRGKRVPSERDLPGKGMHDKKDGGALSRAAPYSKRTRQKTERYQPLMGKSPSCDGKDDNAAAATAAATPHKEYSRSGRRPEFKRMQEKNDKGQNGQEEDRNGYNCRGSKYQKGGGGGDYGGGSGGKEFNNDDDDEDSPTHGYYKVDEILDRRTKKVGSDVNGVGMRFIVEYLVSWKKPRNLNLVDETEYEPSWLVAENLDQHSLAAAFQMFPADADPDHDVEITQPSEKEDGLSDLDDDFSDDGVDEESNCDIEEVDDSSSFDGDIHDYDNIEGDDGDGKVYPNAAKDPNVSLLEDSDYDAPGTVELVVKSKTYRVGQSYFGGLDGTSIYTISMIYPNTRKARCLNYMRMKDSFAFPKGHEDSYVLLGEDVTLDLAALKAPYKKPFTKFSMKYNQEGDNQRAFAYYNDTGKIQHHPTGRPTVLDLFAGAGGMSLGMETYFNVKWIVDNNEIACSTLNSNKKDSSPLVYTEDVKKFLLQSIKGNPCYPSAGEVDHIHASPPCKGFSRANRNGGKNDKQNNYQTLLFVKAIKHFRPKTATFENVPGLVMEDYKGYLQSVISGLLNLSYQVRVQILNSSGYGDPQNRRRLIIMTARSDCRLPDMPPPTHGQGPGLFPIKTCKDAIQLFEKHTPSKSGTALIGTEVIFNHNAPWLNSATRETDYELTEDQPSRTVTACGRPHLHYNGCRFISVREAACLQSFPIKYRFYGSLTQQFAQVGNAVPVKLATAIARSVAAVHGCAV